MDWEAKQYVDKLLRKYAGSYADRAQIPEDEREAWVEFYLEGQLRGHRRFASARLAKQFMRSAEAKQHEANGYKLKLVTE